MAILIYNELLYPTGWALGQHSPLRTYHGIFFKERETLWGYNMAFNLIRKHSGLIFSDNNNILQCDALVHERFGPLYLASAICGLAQNRDEDQGILQVLYRQSMIKGFCRKLDIFWLTFWKLNKFFLYVRWWFSTFFYSFCLLRFFNCFSTFWSLLLHQFKKSFK